MAVSHLMIKLSFKYNLPLIICCMRHFAPKIRQVRLIDLTNQWPLLKEYENTTAHISSRMRLFSLVGMFHGWYNLGLLTYSESLCLREGRSQGKPLERRTRPKLSLQRNQLFVQHCPQNVMIGHFRVKYGSIWSIAAYKVFRYDCLIASSKKSHHYVSMTNLVFGCDK